MAQTQCTILCEGQIIEEILSFDYSSDVLAVTENATFTVDSKNKKYRDLLQIGQKIEFTNGFIVELEKGKKAKIVKGDKAMVVRKVDEKSGEIVYITGEAAGLSQIISIDVDETVDADYIASKIINEL
jgi:hypothetical protein